MLTTSEAVQGQRQSWNLIKKLGEGDAGEVYLVESLLDKQPAILKRPCRGAFFSEILRQARQIKIEGSILGALPRAALTDPVLRINIPGLIDQNRSENDLGEKTFIVIEQAQGQDLKQLSHLMHLHQANTDTPSTTTEYAFLLQQWSQFSEFPSQLLVRILLGVLNLLENIHRAKFRNEQGSQSGVIWNDVKPEHLYWDPSGVQLTVIDWGNSQYLDSNLVTKDRQYSTLNDFHQYIQEMGSYVAEANPDLYVLLEWPEISARGDLYELAIRPLKEKLETLYKTNSEALQMLRHHEADLYGTSKPELEHIAQYEAIRLQLAAFGETPDNFAAGNFLLKAAYQMAAELRLAEFQKVCENAAWLPSMPNDKWNLLSKIAATAEQTVKIDKLTETAFSNALATGVTGDWASALWELFTCLGDGTRPSWWEYISQEVRKVCLGLEPDAITPYTLFSRLYYTLRAEVTRKEEPRLRSAVTGTGNLNQETEGFHQQASEDVLVSIREEIINKWTEIEPCPPNSGIDYSEVDSLVDGIEELLPGWREKLEKALVQPKAQVDLVLNAWEQKEFEQARRGLRSILVWDPDRTRLISAEKAIGAAPQWLARVHRGAGKGEPFYDYLTSVELAGRNLRNQVGPSKWLDETLEAFKRLRRGTRSVDLMMEYPEILNELPWLKEYQSREILSIPHTRPISLERDDPGFAKAKIIGGVVEGSFGPNQNMQLAEPLDTWLPEARGSSARVFAVTLRKQAKRKLSLAFKIIRPDQLEYALPLFSEEIQILTILNDVPGITSMMECGFIKIQDGQALPSDENHTAADQLSGQVIHFGVEQVQNFLASMNRQVSAGWLPYLALERRNPEYNLLHYCDTSYTHGWFLSLRDSLILAIQICDILQVAHDRNIVYRDHKILHYYWDVETHGVTIIDWNIAKHQPQGLSDAEIQFDLVQFGARGLHHILTGRPAQGSLPLGPNRAEDIEKALMHYPVSWTYDDERLPNQLRSILEMTLNQGYTQIRDIRQDLLNIYQQLPGTDKK